MYCKCISKGS